MLWAFWFNIGKSYQKLLRFLFWVFFSITLWNYYQVGPKNQLQMELKPPRKWCNWVYNPTYRTLGIQSYSQMMIRVSNHLLNIVFRFHYHSQKVIGSLGEVISHHL